MSVAKIEILIKTAIIFPKKIAIVFRDFSKLSLFLSSQTAIQHRMDEYSIPKWLRSISQLFSIAFPNQ